MQTAWRMEFYTAFSLCGEGAALPQTRPEDTTSLRRAYFTNNRRDMKNGFARCGITPENYQITLIFFYPISVFYPTCNSFWSRLASRWRLHKTIIQFNTPKYSSNLLFNYFANALSFPFLSSNIISLKLWWTDRQPTFIDSKLNMSMLDLSFPSVKSRISRNRIFGIRKTFNDVRMLSTYQIWHIVHFRFKQIRAARI